MYENNSIAVIVPCFNEGRMLTRVLSTIPDYVDRIFVVDDRSADNTADIARQFEQDQPGRVVLIQHTENQGVGGAIATGYKRARDEDLDVAAVMAGDGQMAPEDLADILSPVVNDECDYSKGNRLFTGDAWNMIPHIRYLGNAVLSLLTKIASGYWHVADSQSGYTAINKKALQAIDWDSMYKRYGQPNDLLVRLNVHNFRVRDVPVKPVYGIGEQSGLRPIRVIPGLSFLLFRLFLFRMLHKYVIRDFHPLLFFYFMGGLLFPSGTLFGLYLLARRVLIGPVAETSALFAALMAILGVQFLLFAMWFDMEYNKHLK